MDSRWSLNQIDYVCYMYHYFFGWTSYEALSYINRCDEQYPQRWVFVLRAVIPKKE